MYFPGTSRVWIEDNDDEKRATLASIPASLRALTIPRFTCYTLRPKSPDQGERLAKRHCNPLTGRWVKRSDPSTWLTYPQAFDAYLKGAADITNDRNVTERVALHGVGLCFQRDDNRFALDLDNILTFASEEAKDGQIDSWARPFVTNPLTYSEESISTLGLHVLYTGTLPEQIQGRSLIQPRVEVFVHNQILCLTGSIIPKSPPELTALGAVPGLLDDLLAWYYDGPLPKGQAGPWIPKLRALPVDLARLAEALRYWNPNVYGDWITVGMALKAQAFIDPGRARDYWELWSLWSQESAKYRGTGEIQSKWDSFRRDPEEASSGNVITLGSIIKGARDQGWDDPLNSPINWSDFPDATPTPPEPQPSVDSPEETMDASPDEPSLNGAAPDDSPSDEASEADPLFDTSDETSSDEAASDPSPDPSTFWFMPFFEKARETLGKTNGTRPLFPLTYEQALKLFDEYAWQGVFARYGKLVPKTPLNWICAYAVLAARCSRNLAFQHAYAHHGMEYCLALMASGGGKGTAMRLASTAIDGGSLRFIEGILSSQALGENLAPITWQKKGPPEVGSAYRAILWETEFKRFLTLSSSTGSNFLPDLCRIYDATDKYSLVRVNKNGGDITIRNHQLSALGTVSTRDFVEAINDAHLSGGFMSRFVIFVVQGVQKELTAPAYPWSMIRGFSASLPPLDWRLGDQDQDIESFYSPEAWKIYAQFHEIAVVPFDETHPLYSWFSRLQAHFHRFALVTTYYEYEKPSDDEPPPKKTLIISEDIARLAFAASMLWITSVLKITSEVPELKKDASQHQEKSWARSWLDRYLDKKPMQLRDLATRCYNLADRGVRWVIVKEEVERQKKIGTIVEVKVNGTTFLSRPEK
jgi:Primase C terminal 2 (PriCT-2)/Protein of unknown function (DUF3987)